MAELKFNGFSSLLSVCDSLKRPNGENLCKRRKRKIAQEKRRCCAIIYLFVVGALKENYDSGYWKNEMLKVLLHAVDERRSIIGFCVTDSIL